MSEEIEWRKLDNSAKIFPISAGKKYSTVFRYSAVLYDNIDEKILVQAVDNSLNKFKYFRMKLRKGFFWHYLEYNDNNAIIEEESDYPCEYVDPQECNDYLFRISYYKNKVNVDYYHALTDGNSALEFFKEIIYQYIELKNPKDFKELSRNKDFLKYEFDASDDFIKNYDIKNKERNRNNELAYVIKGTRLPINKIATIHEYINSNKLKKKAKDYNATITQYLSAVLIYAIYKSNMDKEKIDKRPIKLCIPVNLRRYFQSKTIANFFSYFSVVAHIGKDNLDSFDKILDLVKNEFENKLTKEEIIKTMSANVKIGINPIIRHIPLPFKVLLVRIGYSIIRKYTTITFSNVGRFGILKDYQKYIDHVLMMIAPEPIERIKTTAISFNNTTAVSFTTNIYNADIELEFKRILEEHGLTVDAESNNVIKIQSENKMNLIKTPYPDKINNNKHYVHLEKRQEMFRKKHENIIEIIRKRFNS
ncbi:MAG: hypothetical protein IKG56_03220 [Clostridia bacterium]|nr:hypothetical protein [Clostridia bacterium]